MDETYLDALAEYPLKALHVIGNNQIVVSLLTDNPDVVIGSDEADSVFDKYLFDYDYVDDTTVETAAYICAEAEVSRVSSDTMKTMMFYITVICHKKFMHLDTSKFKGMAGNRRDNLVRYVDNLLSGTDLFGIGKLKFSRVQTVNAPAGFSARQLIYTVPDFNVK